MPHLEKIPFVSIDQGELLTLSESVEAKKILYTLIREENSNFQY